MIKLISLSFNGIGRFAEKQFIDFTVKEKILQIDGKNENTGGSSGSGKSTIFHALDYLLGINDIPATTLQSRLTKNPLSVEGVFEIDGKKVKIFRSKKDGLTIVEENETISGNVKAAEERLDILIGIPKKIFKKMIHKKQKEGGFFLNLTAKESYDFLTKALGLENLTNKIVSIDLDIKTNKEKISLNEKHLAILESGLELSKKDVESFAMPDEVPSLYIKELKSKLEAADEKITILQSKISNTLKEIDLELPAKPVIDNSELTRLLSKLEQDKSTLEHENSTIAITLESVKNSLKHIIKQTEAEINKIPYLRNQITKIAADIKLNMEQKAHIEKSQCPTCMQLWVGNSAHDKINSINTTIERIKKEAQEVVDVIKKEPELQDILSKQTNEITDIENSIKDSNSSYSVKISDLALEISNIKNKIANMEKEANDEYREKFNIFKEKRMNVSIEFNNQISYDRELRNSIKNKYDSAKIEKELYEKSFQMRTVLESKIIKQSLDMEIIKKDTESTQKMIAVAEESKRLIKSYSLQKFQETLNAIGETASDILRGVPNMTTASVYFEGCKETNSGAFKEEVTALINMDGEMDIDIKSLSGGERTSIDLAVDLAVIDVLEVKAGKGADFFILDEPFDSLDSSNKIEFLQLLVNSNLNKRIIIVDHSSEVKEVTNDSIIVHRNGELSCIL